MNTGYTALRLVAFVLFGRLCGGAELRNAFGRLRAERYC